MIFFDARFIRPNSPDGITRFSVELVRQLAKRWPLTTIICDENQKALLPASVPVFLANRPTRALAELLLPLRLNAAGAKMVISPMQTTGSLGRKYRLVLTQHDLIYYQHKSPPNWLPPLVRVGWWLYHLSYWPARWLLNGSDWVLTVSNTSKLAIEQHRLTERPVSVVYNAANRRVDQTRNAAKSKTLIYVGSFMEYKNVELLIRAMAELPNYRLLLLSRIDQRRLAELSKLVKSDNVEFVGGVSEAEYLRLLDEAFALVSASKSEGFGIPVVEAMAMAIPVVLSDLEIFHEVAADAGLYFNPLDATDFVSTITRLSNSELWEKQSLAALERSRYFSWEQSAAVVSEVIERLIPQAD